MCEIAIEKEGEDYICIKYPSQASHVFFDICDLAGNVMTTGRFDNGQIRVKSETMGCGLFTVFVVDCDKLLTKRFEIK